MKCHFRAFAAIVLAVVVSLSSPAFAGPRAPERGRENGPVVRVIKKIRKFLGIATHEEFPLPPIPNPPKT